MSYINASEAAAILEIKKATLYTYVSRGLIRTGDTEGRTRTYLLADVERLRRRTQARAGHTAVAASALDWGQPVIDSAISAIRVDGPVYRGQPAVDLAADDRLFEEVAEFLWSGHDRVGLDDRVRAEWCGRTPEQKPDQKSEQNPDQSWRLLWEQWWKGFPSNLHPLASLQLLVPLMGAADNGRFGAPRPAELSRARGLIGTIAGTIGPRDLNCALATASRPRTVAEGLLLGLGFRATSSNHSAAVRLINRALVLCAEHELNASTFAARVAASTGADLYSCVSAAAAVLSGPRHGGACLRIEAMVSEAVASKDPGATVHNRLQRGESIPGFRHPLYPAGDPRAGLLLASVASLRDSSERSEHVEALLGIVRAMAEAGHPPPTVDVGLVAVAAALGLPPGASIQIFAVGRAAGWVAHVLEQREAGTMLRPRARYVGVD